MDSSTAGLPVDQVQALNATDPNAWLSNVAGDVAASGDKLAQGLIDPVLSIDPFAGVASGTAALGSGLNSNGTDWNLFGDSASYEGFGEGLKTPSLSLESMGGASGVTGTIDGLGTLTSAGLLIPAAGGASAVMPGALSGSTAPSYTDKILGKIADKPLDAAKLAVGGAGLLDTVTGGAVSEKLDKLLGTGEEDSGSTYKSKPIDQSIVDKYSKLGLLGNLNYQQFGSLALPQGLLDARLGRIG